MLQTISDLRVRVYSLTCSTLKPSRALGKVCGKLISKKLVLRDAIQLKARLQS